MAKSTVTSKGQITIPKEVRVMLMIHEGTQIDFQVQKDGKIVMVPILHHVSQLKGIVRSKRKKPVSLKEMKEAIIEGARESIK